MSADEPTGGRAVEAIPCPFCRSGRHVEWAEERGFIAVRCEECGLLFCNPRPKLALIDAAVRTGTHGDEAQGLVVVARRVASKVVQYQHVFGEMFDDVWRLRRPVSWLDVGAGYGEVLEAVTALAPPGSRVVGLEPMHPKALKARARGLTVLEEYLRPGQHCAEIVSIIDVFSHLPDFDAFLDDVRGVLEPHGQIFVETGNLADLARRQDFPGELGLPDHLVFAGEKHLVGYLERAGFEIVHIRRRRIDGFVYLAKNFVKKLLGRPSSVGLPYTSKYRTLQVRARLRAGGA